MDNTPSSPFVFPPRKTVQIVRCAMMDEAERRTLTNHDNSGMVVWSGRSRVGKTTTACEMERRVNEAFDPDKEEAFRAIHFEVGGVGKGYHDDVKKGVRCLFQKVVGRIDRGQYSAHTSEGLAELTVAGLRRKRIELVLVDEAGLLSIDAIRGLVLVRDIALKRGWPLTVVLIGMDDLPSKVEQCAQVHGRIAEWVLFRTYWDSETLALLAALEPRYAGASLTDSVLGAEIRFFHDMYQGLPGQIIPFLTKVQEHAARSGAEISLLLIQATHQITLRDRKSSKHQLVTNYKEPPSKDASK